jgi:tetrahydromethanopterin S-methyltransferase subunit G
MANVVALDSLDSKIDKAVDDLSEIIQTFAQHVDDRFNKLERRVDKIEEHLDKL